MLMENKFNWLENFLVWDFFIKSFFLIIEDKKDIIFLVINGDKNVLVDIC